MKILLVTACNEAAPTVRAISALNESSPVRGGEWTRISPFGRFPVTVTVDGRPRRVVQIVDREAADRMVTAFNSVSTRLASLFRGAPILEGHSDDPGWLARNPGARKAAVGRIRQLEARDDGLYGLPALNSIGDGLVGGDAPAYDGTSPRWNLELIGDRATAREARPVEFLSLALTNTPNIPENLHGMNEDGGAAFPTQTTTMNPLVIELLALLGQTIAADAAPDAIDAALKAGIAKAKEGQAAAVNAATEKAALETKANAAETKATTAANEATVARTALATERAARSALVVASAIQAGRISEADRARWVGALNEATDFAAKVGELEAIKPTINTQSHVGHLGSRREESARQTAGITAINEAVDAHMKTTGTTDRDRAWHAVKAAKPELFK